MRTKQVELQMPPFQFQLLLAIDDACLFVCLVLLCTYASYPFNARQWKTFDSSSNLEKKIHADETVDTSL